MVSILDFVSESKLKTLGENLHWARAEQKLGIEEVAEKIKCSASELDNIECGRTKITEKRLKNLLTLYKEKFSISWETYDDSF